MTVINVSDSKITIFLHLKLLGFFGEPEEMDDNLLCENVFSGPVNIMDTPWSVEKSLFEKIYSDVKKW